MTTNGHNGHAHGTYPFITIGKPGITEPVAPEIPKPCCARIEADNTWCSLPDGHEGEHDGPARYFPHSPPIDHRKWLPAERTWCRYCGWPVPTVTDAGITSLVHHTVDGVACNGGDTKANDHPKFRG